MLLFENFNFRFHVFIDRLFLTCVFTTLAIRHNARMWSVRKSCLYIQNIYLFFSFQVRYNIPGLLLDIFQRSSSWLNISMVDKLIVKNLSTLDGLWEPHPIWIYCRGKTHQGGYWILSIRKSLSTSHQSPVINHGHPVTGHPVTC